jgi:pimeloyl-ACP methyl ester carboxylesterase
MSYSPYYPFKSKQTKQDYTDYYNETAQRIWPVPFENKIVDTDYGPTFIRVSGPVDAPPLVLLHGITATSLMWAPNVLAWSQYFRIYAVDTINDYGLSINTKALLQKNDFMFWLDSLFTNLGLDRDINLVGMSYGGWLTGQYALYHPERLRKIVLLAPGDTVLQMDFRFLKLSALSALFPGHYSQGLFQWLFADGLAHPERCAIKFDDFLHCLEMGFSCFKRRWFVPLSVLSQKDWNRLTMPILFIVGENEKLYPADKALTHLESVAPQVKSVLIPEAGHDLTVVQADKVNEVVLKFLRSL